MGLKATIWAWEQEIDPYSAKMVLVRLAAHADDETGRCWPRQDTLAAACRMSVRTVREAMKTLEGAGLVRREARYRNQHRISDMVTLQLTPTLIYPNGPEADDETPEPIDTKFAGIDDPIPATVAGSARQMSPPVPAESAGCEPSTETLRENPPAEERAPEGLASPSEEKAEPDLGVLAAQIFDACTPAHRRKCGDDPSKIKFALRDAKARGYDPGQVTDAMIAMVTSADQAREGGRFAVGPHRAIDDDRWRNWIGRSPGAAASRAHDAPSSRPTLASEPTTIEFEGKRWTVPIGGQLHKIGTAEQPGIQRQLSIMDRWRPPRRLIDWNEAKWGPPPGAPLCRLWPTVLQNFPHESSGGQG